MNPHKALRIIIFTLIVAAAIVAQKTPIRQENTIQTGGTASCEAINAELLSLNERSKKLASGVFENQKASDRIKGLGNLLSEWDGIITELEIGQVSSNKGLAEITGLTPLKRRNLISGFGMSYLPAWDGDTLGFAGAVRSGIFTMLDRFKKNPQSAVTVPEQRAENEIQIAVARYNVRKQNCSTGESVVGEPTKDISTISTADFNAVTIKDAKPSSIFCEVRFRKVVYTTVCQQQTEMDVPSDVYYYRAPGVTKIPGVNGGDLLWNRFVRTPAVGYKYQAEGTWLHIYWTQENGKWIRKVEPNVAVEFIRKIQ